VSGSSPHPFIEALTELNREAADTARITWCDGHVGDGYRVDRFRFGNGLEVILWPDSTAPVAALHTWFRVGSRHDPANRTGMAHLFEHLMFKATTTRPEGEYDRVMEALGAQTNASTWVDWTNYYAKVPAWDLPTAIDLEVDRMCNLALDADMLEREREVVRNERLMRVDDDPEGRLGEELYRAIYGPHPYGQPTIGWMDDINAIDLDDCSHFYRTWYSASNAVIVVCGDFEPAALLALLQSRYGLLPAVQLPEAILPSPPPETAPRLVHCRAPVQAERRVWAWRGPPSGTLEHAALQIATEILAGSDSSRLIQRLIEDDELATDIAAWVTPWSLESVFEVGMTLRPEADAEVAAAIVEAEIARFVEEGPTELELERTRNGLETDFWRGLADVNARANQLGHAHLTVGDYRDLWSEAERLRDCTVDDVRSALHTWLRGRTTYRARLEPIDED